MLWKFCSMAGQHIDTIVTEWFVEGAVSKWEMSTDLTETKRFWLPYNCIWSSTDKHHMNLCWVMEAMFIKTHQDEFNTISKGLKPTDAKTEVGRFIGPK